MGEFQPGKYTSFVRKLHRWDFLRFHRGKEAGAFYHKDFQKGRLDLLHNVTYLKIKKRKRVTEKSLEVQEKLLSEKGKSTPDVSSESLPQTSLYHQIPREQINKNSNQIMAMHLEVQRQSKRQIQDSILLQQRALSTLVQQQRKTQYITSNPPPITDLDRRLRLH